MSNEVHSKHITDVPSFMADLDGTIFNQKLGQALSDVAAGVMDHNAVGEVTVKFTIKQAGTGPQVLVAHKLSSKRPTARGDRSENNTTVTPMYIGPGGKMTLFPLDQVDMFAPKKSIPEKAV